MRRALAAGTLAVLCVLLLVACGSGRYVRPLPETIIGKVATQQPKGDPAAGKQLFVGSGGCGGCHTYTPAGSNGKVGPNLDNLAADAQKANHGTVADYAHESIVAPNAYVVPGFSSPSAMPSYAGQLNEQQIADLVAFLTQGAK